MFEGFRTHYISHVYAAMRDYINAHPEMVGTIAYTQLVDIRDAAESEWNFRDRAETAERAREYWEKQNEKSESVV